MNPLYMEGIVEYRGYEVLGGIDTAVGGANGEGKVLGVFIYQNEQYGNPYIIAARKDAGANTYSFWKFLDCWMATDNYRTYAIPHKY